MFGAPEFAFPPFMGGAAAGFPSFPHGFPPTFPPHGHFPLGAALGAPIGDMMGDPLGAFSAFPPAAAPVEAEAARRFDASSSVPSLGESAFDASMLKGFDPTPAVNGSAALPPPPPAAAPPLPVSAAVPPAAAGDGEGVVLFTDADQLSPHVRAVLYFALASGIPVKCCPIDLAAGDNTKDAYLAIHPEGKVPAMRDHLLYLFESAAIMRYLALRYGSPLEGGSDPAQYGKVQCAIEYVRNTVVAAANALSMATTVRELSGEEPDAAAAEQAQADLLAGLTFLTKHFYQHSADFVIGTSLTTADVWLAVALKTIELVPDDYAPNWGESHPKVMAAVQKLAYTEAFACAHQRFNAYAEARAPAGDDAPSPPHDDLEDGDDKEAEKPAEEEEDAPTAE